jgi:hypothetical protein
MVETGRARRGVLLWIFTRDSNIPRRARSCLGWPGCRAVGGPLYSEPRLEPWREWLRDPGRATYFEYLVTYPIQTLALRFQDHPVGVQAAAAAVAAAADLVLTSLSAMKHRSVAGSRPCSPLVGLGVGSRRGLGRNRPRTQLTGSLTLIGLALIVSAGPSALLAWHGAGIETARHVLRGR